jgi:2-hydroxychromene-2-carboxylate isomerase
MAQEIEFWFDFSSPYAYFGAREIEALAARHRRGVTWRPFLLGAAFAATGAQPLVRIPLRGDYARHDWARLARRAGITFTLPPSFPTGTVAASRAFYWLEAEQPDLATPFVQAVFRAYFSDGREVHQPEQLLAFAAERGIDRSRLEAALADPTLKAKLRAATDEALARGIFGSPFIIVDGEAFWGADRLPMVDEWLQRGGW